MPKRTTSSGSSGTRGTVVFESEHIDSVGPDDIKTLAAIIEQQVIPDLARARDQFDRQASPRLTSREIRTLVAHFYPRMVEMLLDDDLAQTLALIEEVLKRGVPVQNIYLDLLGPAARQFGQMWLDDELDFFGVTRGLGAIQLALTRIGDQSIAESHRYDDTRRIAIARAPNAQHFFGIITVREFFLLGGWEVVGGIDLEVGDDLFKLVSENWFPLIGISAGVDAQVSEVAEAIPHIREVAKNGRMGIIVGGPVFTNNPDMFNAVGADAMATDAEQALREAEKLLEHAFE